MAHVARRQILSTHSRSVEFLECVEKVRWWTFLVHYAKGWAHGTND